MAMKEEKRIWKCAVYCRISIKDNGRADGDSIESQESIVRDGLARFDDVRIVEVFRDNGFTGTNFDKRPAFNEILKKVAEGEIDCIAVKDLSRFGRNYLEAGHYIERVFPKMGVRLIAISDCFDSMEKDDGESDVTVPVKNLVNELHSRDISRKSIAAYKARAMAGTARIVRAPYGYIKDPADPTHLIVDEEAALIVKRIYQEAIDGKGSTNIAHGLDRDHIPTPSQHQGLEKTVGKWSPTVIRRIIENPVYVGDLVQGRIDGSIFSDSRGPKPEEEYIIHKNAHEAIVTREEAEAAGRYHAHRRKIWAEGVGQREEVRKLVPDFFQDVGVWCGRCGKRMAFRRNFFNGKLDGSTYLCKRCENKQGDTYPHIAADVVRIVVGDEIRRQLSLHLMFKRMGATVAPNNRFQKRKESAARRLAKAERDQKHIAENRRHLYEKFAMGRMSEAEWIRRKEELDEKARKVTEQLTSAKAAVDAFDKAWEPDPAVEETVRNYGTQCRLTYDLVNKLVERVEVYDRDTVRIVLKFQDYEQRITALKGVKKC